MAEKDFKLYYSATEVAELLNESIATISYWEKTYKINAPHSQKGVKRYRQKEVDKLKQIHYLIRNKHLSRRGVIAALQSGQEENIDRRAEVLRLLENASKEVEEILQMMDEYRMAEVKGHLNSKK